MLKKVLAAGALVVASLVAFPLAADAADYGTPVSSGATVTTGTGDPIVVSVNVATSGDGTTNVSVDGPGTATITPTVISTGIANVRSGVAYFTITPSVAGDYTATISGGVVTATAVVTVTTVDPTLPFTGVNDPTPTIWLASGLVLVGVALIVTFVAVRRQNAKLHQEA